MNILITGGAGFVPSSLEDKLIEDPANNIVLSDNFLLENNQNTNFDIINLGTGNGVSVFEAIESFERVTGQKLNYTLAPRREGDVEAIYSDCSKSKIVLNWQAKLSLDEMMGSAWECETNAFKNEN
jgi:UDP-glucose 4-epimerase